MMLVKAGNEHNRVLRSICLVIPVPANALIGNDSNPEVLPVHRETENSEPQELQTSVVMPSLTRLTHSNETVPLFLVPLSLKVGNVTLRQQLQAVLLV